ncbi:MAG: hypothetical protein AABY18_00540 [Candidatus Thermoplasmatota archaeon]
MRRQEHDENEGSVQGWTEEAGGEAEAGENEADFSAWHHADADGESLGLAAHDAEDNAGQEFANDRGLP